jgi:hypothetical protein
MVACRLNPNTFGNLLCKPIQIRSLHHTRDTVPQSNDCFYLWHAGSFILTRKGEPSLGKTTNRNAKYGTVPTADRTYRLICIWLEAIIRYLECNPESALFLPSMVSDDVLTDKGSCD